MTFQPKTNSLNRVEHEELMNILQGSRFSFVLLIGFLGTSPKKLHNEMCRKLVNENEANLRDFLGDLPKGWKLYTN